MIGIGLGLVTLFLALPPVKVRTAPLPVAIGILAVAAGIWAFTPGEHRLGGGAVVSRGGRSWNAPVGPPAKPARARGGLRLSGPIAATPCHSSPPPNPQST